jgi:hypothetical protein
MKITPGTKSDPANEGSQPDPDSLAEKEPWLRCGRCEARICRESSRIAINGAHAHEFMNPAGLRFNVGCFSSAEGCTGDGDRSTVWTWFPGYAWEVECCRTCSSHLGWSFHGASSFYGLILDRLK